MLLKQQCGLLLLPKLQKNYEAATKTMDALQNELTQLREYKAQKTAEERKAEEDAVFSMFADLNGVAAFESLRENCGDMSIMELEEKCFAIRGRNYPLHTFSTKKSKTPRVPVIRDNPYESKNQEPYGGLFLEFPPLG